jgi:hypothetical protein
MEAMMTVTRRAQTEEEYQSWVEEHARLGGLTDAIRRQLRVDYFYTLVCVCGFVSNEVVSIQSIIDQVWHHRRKHAACTPVLGRPHLGARRGFRQVAYSDLRCTGCGFSTTVAYEPITRSQTRGRFGSEMATVWAEHSRAACYDDIYPGMEEE